MKYNTYQIMYKLLGTREVIQCKQTIEGITNVLSFIRDLKNSNCLCGLEIYLVKLRGTDIRKTAKYTQYWI